MTDSEVDFASEALLELYFDKNDSHAYDVEKDIACQNKLSDAIDEVEKLYKNTSITIYSLLLVLLGVKIASDYFNAE